jgi:hypothetical protein
MKKLSAPAAYYRNCRRTRSPSAWILDRTSCYCVLQASLDKINGFDDVLTTHGWLCRSTPCASFAPHLRS